MASEPKPSIGRIVLVRHRDGRDIAAIITALVDDETAVHVDQFPPPGVGAHPVNYQWGFDYSAEPRAGTWRWPERV